MTDTNDLYKLCAQGRLFLAMPLLIEPVHFSHSSWKPHVTASKFEIRRAFGPVRVRSSVWVSQWNSILVDHDLSGPPRGPADRSSTTFKWSSVFEYRKQNCSPCCPVRFCNTGINPESEAEPEPESEPKNFSNPKEWIFWGFVYWNSESESESEPESEKIIWRI